MNNGMIGVGLEGKTLEYSKLRRWKNTIVGIFTKPYNIIVACALIVLTYLIVVPLIDMIVSTFHVLPGDVRRIQGAAAGDFTLFYWTRVFASELSSALLFRPLMNSIIIGLSVSAIGVTFGALVAWLMVRSDLPGKKFFSLVLLIPYMLPSWCIAMTWMSVFKTERMGGSPGFLQGLGIVTPEWLAYGPVPIILVLAISNYAFAYLLTSGALRSVNSEVEEMGELAGAGKMCILRKITFPLVMPAILSSFILTFSKSIGSFSVPAFLGMRVGYNTISTMLFSSIRQRDSNSAYVISLVLIATAAIAIYMNHRVIGARKSYATIGGKGGRSNLVSLGKWKYPIVVSLMLFVAFAIFLPLLILTIETFMLRPGRFEISNFTLHYWIGESIPNIGDGEPGVLRNWWFWQSARNTLLLGFSAAVLGTMAGQILGYICSRGRGRFSGRTIEQLSFMPFLIPSISFGAIYLSMFAQPRLFIPALYGTFALLVLICMVDGLPFSTRAGVSNMLQIGFELEEAASIEGASFIRRFRKIVFPLAKPGFLSGFMLIFISVIKELDLLILILTPRLSTLPSMMFSYVMGGVDEYGNVVVVIMFIIILSVYIIANKIGKADLAAGIGGA